MLETQPEKWSTEIVKRKDVCVTAEILGVSVVRDLPQIFTQDELKNYPYINYSTPIWIEEEVPGTGGQEIHHNYISSAEITFPTAEHGFRIRYLWGTR